MRKCRIGTAKFFTLLLLLYHTSVKAAGIEHCRFHDLRHANAAVMLRLGVDSRYAQERNGWASDRMYKQVYGYTMDDRMKDIAASIDNYFADKFTDGEKKP